MNIVLFRLGVYNNASCTGTPKTPEAGAVTPLSDNSLVARWFKPLPNQYDINFKINKQGQSDPSKKFETNFGPIATEQRTGLEANTAYTVELKFSCFNNGGQSTSPLTLSGKTKDPCKFFIIFSFLINLNKINNSFFKL